TDGDAATASGEISITGSLSYGQRAMWFLHQLAPESPAYNITVPMRVRGWLDAGVMRRAFQVIIGRHECLRSGFEMVGGEVVQIVRETSEAPFNEVDITAWDDDDVSDFLVEEAYRPFDLQAGPLLRINLLRRSPEEHILQFSAHHIVADFWSLDVLIDELGI